MNPLKSDEYPSIYNEYIDTVSGDIMQELEGQLQSFPTFIREIPEEDGGFAYLPDKWTIKEVLCHVTDTERVMAYRALRFARNDMTALATFEQEELVINGRHNERSFSGIIEEFIAVRQSNIILFRTLNEKEWERKGMASERLLSVRALAYIIAGHLNHHRSMLTDRYLKAEKKNDLV